MRKGHENKRLQIRKLTLIRTHHPGPLPADLIRTMRPTAANVEVSCSLFIMTIDHRMTFADFDPASFDPPGRCIYCTADGTPGGLHDEHIIPLALGGRTILPKASCQKCEGITHAFEGQTAHHFFDAVRWQNEMPSRRPTSKRPTSLSAIVGSAGTITTLPLPDHPSLGYLLDLPNPGIFRGMEPSDVFKDVTVHAFVAVPNLEERIARLQTEASPIAATSLLGPIFERWRRSRTRSRSGTRHR